MMNTKIKNKKITIIDYSPARINTYSPIYNKLKSEGFNVERLVFNEYGNQILDMNPIDLENISPDVLYNKVYSLLENSDLVLYSIEGGKVDSIIPEICNKLDILSIGNIFTFFYDNSSQIISDFGDKAHPNYTTVPKNNYVKLIKDSTTGIILVWGNPYNVREIDLNSKYETVIGTLNFFSQPKGSGVNEKTDGRCIEMINDLSYLKDIGYLKDIKIYIHPREDNSWYIQNGFDVHRIVDFEEAMSSEYIASVSSTVFYEGILLGKKGLKYDNNLIANFISQDFEKFDMLLGNSIDILFAGIKDILEDI